MKSATYSKFIGIDRRSEQIDMPQVGFLTVENFLPSQVNGVFVKRGGSKLIDITGDVWGIGGYSVNTTSDRLPIRCTPIHHRRDGSTSYLEAYDWTNETWEELTLGDHVSLDIGNLASFAQIRDFFAIAAGRPCKILDIDSEEVTRLGGDAPTTAPTISTSAGTLNGTFGYFYTFYDSATNWESSPSPLTDLEQVTDKKITLSDLETTVTREGVTHKRIYRTVRTGEQPHLLLATVTLATTSYEDTTSNDDDLGAAGPDVADHEPPPEDSYIVIAHENRLWVASGNDLYYSHPYVEGTANLEYFSENRKFSFHQRITGLAKPRSGGLYVFNPPRYGINEIQGRNETEFVNRQIYSALGTNYHSSVATKGDIVAFWGETGPTAITPGGEEKILSDHARAMYEDILTRSYDNYVFVWGLYHPVLSQFIFGFSSVDVSSVPWTNSVTSAEVTWINSATGAEVEWITS